MQRSTLPLLRQLAAAPGSPVRPDIALVVRALAEGPRVQLPLDERDFWSDALLQWLVQLPGGGAAAGGAAAAPQQQQPKSEQRQQQRGGSGGEAQAAELMAPITAALRALAAPAGSDGLHVAHAWLAELIVHLSRQVKPYHAVDVPAEQSSASGADRGGGAAAAAAGGGGSWWWPFGGAGAAAAQADAAAAAAAAAAVGDGGAEVAAEEGAAEEVAVGPYLHMDAAAAAAAAAESAAGGAGGSWWRPSSWWPWGEAEDSREGVAAAKAAGAAKPSDSELALYINASEVGPLYARSVAAALLEASGRVGEPGAATGWGGRTGEVLHRRGVLHVAAEGQASCAGWLCKLLIPRAWWPPVLPLPSLWQPPRLATSLLTPALLFPAETYISTNAVCPPPSQAPTRSPPPTPRS